MTAPLTPERLAEVGARAEMLAPRIDTSCPVEVADKDGHLEPCNKVSGSWRWYDGGDHEPMLVACCYSHETDGAEVLAQVVVDDVPDLLAEVERLTERAEAAEAEAKAVRIDRQLLLDERVEVGALRAALNTEEMEPYRDLAHYGKQAHRLGEARKRAEAVEAALVRVEALADHWDEVADMWPYAHWHDSQKANARKLREVMKDQS